MTDNEIKNSLECCAKNKREFCFCCCLHKTSDCIKILNAASLDLINRQQAEIENYSHNNEKLVVENLQMIKSIKHLKSNTIKEFWGKLKNYSRKMQSSDFSGEFWDRAILVTDGDNLVKEMVGENNG